MSVAGSSNATAAGGRGGRGVVRLRGDDGCGRRRARGGGGAAAMVLLNRSSGEAGGLVGDGEGFAEESKPTGDATAGTLLGKVKAFLTGEAGGGKEGPLK